VSSELVMPLSGHAFSVETKRIACMTRFNPVPAWHVKFSVGKREPPIPVLGAFLTTSNIVRPPLRNVVISLHPDVYLVLLYLTCRQLTTAFSQQQQQRSHSTALARFSSCTCTTLLLTLWLPRTPRNRRACPTRMACPTRTPKKAFQTLMLKRPSPLLRPSSLRMSRPRPSSRRKHLVSTCFAPHLDVRSRLM
jgi:hypothetical protein